MQLVQWGAERLEKMRWAILYFLDIRSSWQATADHNTSQCWWCIWHCSFFNSCFISCSSLYICLFLSVDSCFCIWENFSTSQHISMLIVISVSDSYLAASVVWVSGWCVTHVQKRCYSSEPELWAVCPFASAV